MCWLAWLLVLPLLAVDVEEHVVVKGRIFSEDLRSKNMLIISAADIQALGIGSVADLFSFFTALHVSRRGPVGISFDLSMRGSHFEQVLVLLDSVPMNNPQSGHFNTDFPFSLNDIERIEIVRGGSSTAHGAGAFAGMVNIILKKKSSAAAALSVGSSHSFSGQLQWGGAAGPMGWHFSAQRANSRGFHPGREFDQGQLAGSVSLALGRSRLECVGGYLSKDFGAAGFYEPAPSQESVQASLFNFNFQGTAFRARYQLGGSLQGHEDAFILDRFQPDRFRNRSRTRNQFFFVSAVRDWRSLRLAAGVEWLREGMRSTGMGDHGRRRTSLYLNGSTSLAHGIADFGVRGEWSAGSAGHCIFYSGYGRRFSERLLARLSLGRSLRLPSFTELYYHSPMNHGNRDLSPETSWNAESSLTWFGRSRTLDASVFFRRQGDTIDWVRRNADVPWRAVNLRKNDLLGVELTQQWRRERFSLVASFEKLWVLNEQESIQSKYGLRFPDFSLKAASSFQLGKGYAVAGQYLYKRIFRTSERGHFLNAVLSRRWRRWELSLRVDNALNTIIEEIPGIAIDGRSVSMAIACR